MLSQKTEFLLKSRFSFEKEGKIIFKKEDLSEDLAYKMLANIISQHYEESNVKYYSYLSDLFKEVQIDNFSFENIKRKIQLDIFDNTLERSYSGQDAENNNSWLMFLIDKENYLPNDLLKNNQDFFLTHLILNNTSECKNDIIEYYINNKPETLHFIINEQHISQIVINNERVDLFNILSQSQLSFLSENLYFKHCELETLDKIISLKLLPESNNLSSWYNLYSAYLNLDQTADKQKTIERFNSFGLKEDNLIISENLLKLSLKNFCSDQNKDIEDSLFNRKIGSNPHFLNESKYDLSFSIMRSIYDEDLTLLFFKKFIDLLANNNIYVNSETLHKTFESRTHAYTDDELEPFKLVLINKEKEIIQKSFTHKDNKQTIKRL